MPTPDADERGTRDYNKRIDHCKLHFDFSFAVTSAALGLPSRNSVDRILSSEACGSAASLPGTPRLSSEGTSLTNPSFDFDANFRVKLVALSC